MDAAVVAARTGGPRGEQTEDGGAGHRGRHARRAAPQATTPPPALRRVPAGDDDAVDLLECAGAPLLRRVLPAVGVAVLLLVVWRLLVRPRG